MRGYTAIVNPTAGGGSAVGKAGVVARLLRSAGADVRVEYSRGMAHAIELAAEAVCRDRVVVAIGGDGMVGALAGAVAEARGLLGVVPAGRGNDLARQLRIPSRPEPATMLLLRGKPREIDVILASDRLVVGSVYAGIDSVANRYANQLRFIKTQAVYYLAALRAILSWRRTTFQITVDGTTYTERGYAVVAANAGYYGGGLRIAPDAAVDDGLLDVVIIGHVPKRLSLAVMRELRSGVHVRRPQIRLLQGREVRIEADRRLPYCGDGEVIGVLPATARLRPAGLRVLAPPIAVTNNHKIIVG